MTTDRPDLVAPRADPTAPPGSTALLELHDVERSYGRRGPVLGPFDLAVEAGSATALVGRSGSGKSTLLDCAAGLVTVTRGSVRFQGRDIARLPEHRRAALRCEQFGFVFQDYTLIDALSVAENIELPRRLVRRPPDPRRVAEVAHSLGLGDLLHRSTADLSGGQRQRVAIARAVASDVRVLFADEPTGALDPITRDEVISVLLSPSVRASRAVLIATHDVDVAARTDRVLVIDGGRICAELLHPAPERVLAALRAVEVDR
ncbi:ABC transporter ATP-binding protein [Cellulomonas triticagri]|uniref:ABC transporter ATP-binding protein n=1 Tax=Cellulomonas triticagri TaxID=2483352 RepID=A0A3M2JIQ1_9CELL|nr:ABC transporter ATP-binding protein [Cellulomonas triticagri]RMI12954.1 ABC transporter ATP-binding protein [Cellulomonas triticagri]